MSFTEIQSTQGAEFKIVISVCEPEEDDFIVDTCPRGLLSSKVSDTEYKLISKATIESGWHLYSQNVPEDGPIPTSFVYDESNGAFKFIDNTSEEKGQTIDDPVFQMKIKFFEKLLGKC